MGEAMKAIRIILLIALIAVPNSAFAWSRGGAEPLSLDPVSPRGVFVRPGFANGVVFVRPGFANRVVLSSLVATE